MKQFIRFQFFFLLVFISAQVCAATSHFYVTNNTPHTLSVTSEQLPGGSTLASSYWAANNVELGPYERQDVLQVSRDKGIGHKKKYQFLIKMHLMDQSNTSTLLNISLTGKSIYGSKIATRLQLPNTKAFSILEKNGIEHYTTHFGNDNAEVYTRAWRPIGKFSDSYHLVLHVPQKRAHQGDSPEVFRLLTYNTKLDPYFFRLGQDKSLNHPYVRAEDIPKFIKQYDAVVLEELFSPPMRDIVIANLKDYYPYHTDVVGSHAHVPLSGGVMIFSRWPIVRESQTVYKDCGGIDCKAGKGVIYADIDKAGYRYHVFGTHMQAGYGELRSLALAQFDQFVKSQNIPLSDAVLVAGDFNMHESDSDQPQLIHDVLHATLIKPTGFPYSNHFTNMMNSGHNQDRIDFVFPVEGYKLPKVSENRVQIYKDLGNDFMWNNFDLSDHYAVAGYFDYRRNQ